MKQCNTCKVSFPATTEYFRPRPDAKDGLRGECLICYKKYHDEYYQRNAERQKEWQRNYHMENREKGNQASREYYRKNPEYNQEYYRKNRDARRENTRRWRENNPDKELAYRRQYTTINRDMLRAKTKAYMQKNPEKYATYSHNRRARKLNLPNTLTGQEINRCLDYFNYTCPVCDRQLRDLFGEIVPHIDHWIPLASPECLGTVAKISFYFAVIVIKVNTRKCQLYFLPRNTALRKLSKF